MTDSDDYSVIRQIKIVSVFFALIFMAFWLPQLLVFVVIIGLGLLIARYLGVAYVAGIILSLLVYGLMGALLLHLATMLGLHVDLRAYTYVVNVLFMLAMTSLRHEPKDVGKRPSASEEFAHALLFLVTCVFLLLPTMNTSSSRFFEIIGVKEDTSSQFQMFNAVVKTDRVAYQNSDERPVIRDSLRTYPQVGHAAMAITGAPMLKSSTTVQKLKWYYIYFVVVYSGLIYMVFLLCDYLIRQKRTTNSENYALLMGGLIIVLGGLGLLISLFLYGFYGQVFSYTSLLLGFLAATMLLQKEKNYNQFYIIGCLLVFGLAVFGVFGSWYLLSPILLPHLMLVGLLLYRQRRRVSWLLLISILSPVLIGVVYLAYVYLVLAPSGTGHLLTPGGVLHLPKRLYILIGVTSASILYPALRRRQTALLALAGSVFIASAFSYAVGKYQLIKIGHVDYYFYKSLFTAVFLAVPMCIIALVYQQQNCKSIFDRMATLMSVACLVCLVWVSMAITGKSASEYTARAATVKQGTNPSRFDTLLDEKVYGKYGDAIYVGQCDPYLNFMGTIWAGSTFANYYPGRTSLEATILNESTDAIDKAAMNYAELVKQKTGKKLLVINEGNCPHKQPELDNTQVH